MKFWQVVLILGVIVVVQIEGFSLSNALEQDITQEGETKRKLSGINQIQLLSQNESLLVHDYVANEEEDEDEDNVENTSDVLDDIYGGRIVGGEPTSILKFPHQVSLRFNRKHICGGAIISTNVVITAAHCVYSSLVAQSYTVRVGSSQYGRLGKVVRVRRILIHAQFRPENSDNDVALLYLARNLNFTNEIQPVSLPGPKDQLIEGMELLVSGWGAREEGQLVLPSILQYAAVRLISRDVCRRNYQSVLPITANMICAGAPGRDSCQGDSGGPLVKSVAGVNVLYGIVSFGIGCANPRFPGVYTNVFMLMPWFKRNLNLTVNS